VELLARKHNPRDVKRALQGLKEKLEDSYDEIMRRIRAQDPEDAELALRILTWISYSKRPLTINELQHALSVDDDSVKLEEDAFTHQELLVAVCMGIITVDDKTSIIRFVHYTAQDYIQSCREKLLQDTEPEVMIADVCMKYICFSVFSVWPIEISAEADEGIKAVLWLSKYCFASYALEYWLDHTRGRGEVKLRDQVLSLLAQFQDIPLFILRGIVCSPLPERISRPKLYCGTPLQIAATNDLTEICAALLSGDSVHREWYVRH
jgi:hypothetical protein